MRKKRNYLVFYVFDKDMANGINDRIRVVMPDGTVLVQFAEDDRFGISVACSGVTLADALVNCKRYDRELCYKSVLLDVIAAEKF